MIPVPDTRHVAEGVALLTSQYNSQPVIAGLTTALMLRLQAIENSFWDLIAAVQLSNHPHDPTQQWDILDRLGSIVGAPRNGMADVDYLAYIKLQAHVNQDRGNPEDILALGRLMSAIPPIYLEMPTAAFYLGAFNITPTSWPEFTGLLKQIRPAGVYALLLYTTWAPGNDAIWSSRYTASAGQGVWGSRYGGVTGGKLAAALPF